MFFDRHTRGDGRERIAHPVAVRGTRERATPCRRQVRRRSTTGSKRARRQTVGRSFMPGPVSNEASMFPDSMARAEVRAANNATPLASHLLPVYRERNFSRQLLLTPCMHQPAYDRRLIDGIVAVVCMIPACSAWNTPDVIHNVACN